MADLSTVDGYQITFNPSAVIAIADHDLLTDAPLTCIYGITRGVLRTQEPVSSFLTRLNLTAEFSQLTRPTGAAVWIRGSAVVCVRVPLPNEYGAGVNSVVTAGAVEQGVQEIPQDVILAVNASGGNL